MDELIGKFVIVRCKGAGIHAGFLSSYNNGECVLKKSRRLWNWYCADNAFTLSGMANNGLRYDKSKISETVELIYLTNVCEIIPCTEKSQKSIENISAHKGAQ